MTAASVTASVPMASRHAEARRVASGSRSPSLTRSNCPPCIFHSRRPTRMQRKGLSNPRPDTYPRSGSTGSPGARSASPQAQRMLSQRHASLRYGASTRVHTIVMTTQRQAKSVACCTPSCYSCTVRAAWQTCVPHVLLLWGHPGSLRRFTWPRAV